MSQFQVKLLGFKTFKVPDPQIFLRVKEKIGKKAIKLDQNASGKSQQSHNHHRGR